MNADTVNEHAPDDWLKTCERATRAGGPGGQHVNTSSTRVELSWNLERSRAPSEEQRARLREKLASRLDADGNVRVVASSFRSQLRNREDAEERLVALVRRALQVPKVRRKTKPHRAAQNPHVEMVNATVETGTRASVA